MASHRLLFLAACAALLLGACVQESRAWGTPAPPSESECRPYIEKALKEMEHHDETGPQDEAAVSAESEQQAGGSAEDVVATAEGIDGTSLEEGQSTEATEGGDSTEEAGEPNEEAAQSTEETGGESAESEAGATTEGGESTEEAAAADASAEGSESTETAAEESGEAVAEGGESNEESAASTEAAAEGGESAEAAVEDSEPTEAATSAEEVAEGSQSAEGDESTEATAEGGESTEDAAAASGESTEAEALQADELTEAASESGESTEAGEQGEAAAGGESAEDAAAVSSESIEETATTEEGESSEAAGAGDESVEAAAISSESTEETTDAGSESAEAPAEGADAAEAPEEAAEGGESLESAEDAAASEGGDSAEANATESADGESTEAEAAASVESTEDATTSTESTEEAALEGESTVAAADESQSAENVSAEGQESGEATSAEATEASVESKESTENVGDQSSTEQEATSAEVALSAESAEQLETQTETAEELPEEDLTLAIEIPENLRPRDHISRVLKLDEESAESEVVWEKVADGALRELKRLYDTAIKPLEMLYKYRDLSNRHFGDPEIFSKPLILFMGPWSGGKSTIINYLLDNEYNQYSLRTGAEPSPAYFNILMHGERSEILDGTQLAADWTFSGLQKFGQGLLDRLRGVKLNSPLLEKVNIVEIPGILEIRKQVERMFPFNDACQWFIDRADIIFLVYDPSKLDVGPETEAILDQLKGREYQTRIILNKADQVKPEELMRVQGTLIWNISPLMSSAEPPIMYSTSLWSMPYESGAPVRLLQAQEHAFLRDLREAINKRVDNKIASARRFAVRVRNHAKMVDCYLTTYYNHKTFFGNKKKTADDIIEHPQEYHIYEGLSTLTNISRYDLPDPETYRDFFKLNPLYEFQQLAATCTYFRGCPINRLDVAIAYDLPELVGKYKKSAEDALEQYQKNLPKS